MFLKQIKLTNFRNFKKLDFKFKTPITILKGDNAQGKTNFLESIYFLASSKSNRSTQDQELILEGEDFLRVEGNLKDGTTLEVALQLLQQDQGIKKRVKVNGIPRKVLDYSSNLVVIEFSPEDINLVKGSPSLRRSHIDQVLSQIDRSYKKTLSNYEGVVINKNRLLKRIQEGFSKVDELLFWTDQQILLGNILIEKRRAFFEFINSAERKFGDFRFEYKPNLISLERLKEYKQKEIFAASSLIGPHRDDFTFFLEEKDLSKFGSRGEQRTAVLDLKLTQLNYVEEVLGNRPVLLLDDIFSELDDSHRKHVADLSNLQQTVITTVEWDAYLKKTFAMANVLTVENGQITLKADK